MESNLSQLSSLCDDDTQPYIQPHYKESYRLAIYALLCGGREAYEEFLRAEQISNFLSEEEVHFILENAELPAEEDECEAKRPRDAASPSTYFPLESDEEVPDLELGWPEASPDAADTSISLLFNPPRLDTPTIKEVIRKQIQEAQQVRADAGVRRWICWCTSVTLTQPARGRRSETCATPSVEDKKSIVRALRSVVCFPVVALWALDERANLQVVQNFANKQLIAAKNTKLHADDSISDV